MSGNKMETIVKKRTNEVLGDIRKLQFSVKEIPSVLGENRTDEYKSISADAALRSEVIACRMRHFFVSLCRGTKAAVSRESGGDAGDEYQRA